MARLTWGDSCGPPQHCPQGQISKREGPRSAWHGRGTANHRPPGPRQRHPESWHVGPSSRPFSSRHIHWRCTPPLSGWFHSQINSSQRPNTLPNPADICGVYSPAAVPQHGGTHQAEEKMVAMTSSGNRVTFLWTCRRLSTKARTTPTENSTRLLCTRW